MSTRLGRYWQIHVTCYYADAQWCKCDAHNSELDADRFIDEIKTVRHLCSTRSAYYAGFTRNSISQNYIEISRGCYSTWRLQLNTFVSAIRHNETVKFEMAPRTEDNTCLKKNSPNSFSCLNNLYMKTGVRFATA